MPYDVYLSYRRESGATEARLLQSSLQARGKQSFLDVTDMGADVYGVVLLEQIAQAPNFILILAPGALDRCRDPQDWLRQEIGQAFRTGSNIVPLLLPGFVYPQDLPADIRVLTLLRGVEYNLRAFDTMLAEIVLLIGPAQALKLQVQAATAATAQPSMNPPAIPRVETSAPFNWKLAGLLFLAEFVPSLVISIFEPPSLIFRLMGHAFFLAIAIALVTTVVSQKIRDPFVIMALCGLNEVVVNYFLGALFFGSFRMYALGLFAVLYGAMVPGSVALARVPRAPRWTLLVGPVAGAVIFTTVSVVTSLPGYSGSIGVDVSRLLTPLFMGVAFFVAVRRESSV